MGPAGLSDPRGSPAAAADDADAIAGEAAAPAFATRVAVAPHVATDRDEHRMRERIAGLGRSLFARGLTAGSSGNLSARLDDGRWLLTPTNACLGELDPARLARLDVSGGRIDGDPPSKEAPLHRAMYEARPSARAIVHLHATHSAAVSCLHGLDPHDCLPPLTPYFVMKIGRLPLVPYHRPGDPRLADAIRGLARCHCAVLLANHGPVVSGESLEAATWAIEELEETAKLALLLRGSASRPLDDTQIDELRRTFALDLPPRVPDASDAASPSSAAAPGAEPAA